MSRPVLQKTVDWMIDSQIHRGPDDKGVFVDEISGIALAHRRLSLVGVENGRQPIPNEDGTLMVAANGEFFNHREKRRMLEALGHRFSTRSDCEIIVHLYEEFGLSMFDHFRGQYAFALLDRRKRRLILTRDRFGIVPLHWARTTDGGLVFSSEIKGIFSSGLVKPVADHRGLDHVFHFFALPSGRTCFKGVSSILPGHFLEIDLDSGTTTERQHWDFNFPDAGQETDSDKKTLITEFGSRLMEATRLRLRADVPVASYLSGGIDSTTILKLAGKIPAFTIEIPSPRLNEVGPAQLAAEQIGTTQKVVTCSPEIVGNAYPKLIRACEAPVMDTSSAALLCLSEKVKQDGYKTVLSGEGADEALAGYPWFKSNRLMSLLDCGDWMPSNWVRRFAGKLNGRQISWKDACSYQDLIGGAPALSDFYGLLRAGRRQFYSGTMWESIGDFTPYQDLKLNLREMRRWSPLNRSIYFGYKTILPGLLMNQKGDRPAMANSIEVRYPFLDEDFVDFCTRLPPRWKLHGLLRDKRVLREFGREIALPDCITKRRKHIFRAPFAATFFASPPKFVDELLSEESLKQTGYFDVEQVREQFIGYLKFPSKNRRLITEMALSTVMSTQIWHHTFLGGGLCEDLPSFDFQPSSSSSSSLSSPPSPSSNSIPIS